MAALLALAGALGWGIGDFLGGIAARRLAVVTVLLVSQTVGLVGVYVWVLAARDPFPGIENLLPAAAAGVLALAGLGALYRGFAIGAMGIVAPISATAPVVPLAFDTAQGRAPTPAQWLGVVLVLLGIVLLSWHPSPDGGGRVAAGAGLAVLAAVGFGLFFVGLDAGSDESVPWAVAAARTASVPVAAVVALATSTSLVPPCRLLPLLVGIGVFDTGANVLFATASTYGAVGIVSVLSSLYPITTMALAWLLLGERLGAKERGGAVVALAGAALVAAG